MRVSSKWGRELVTGDARGAAIVDGEKLTHYKAYMKDQPTVLVLPGISRRIVGCLYDVYNELGHGFLEAVFNARYASH